MHADYLHKSCNKTSRKFFEDFDLLPAEFKALLWYQNGTPDFDDLRAAWQLSGENYLDSTLKLHSFKKERQAKEIEDARAKRDKLRSDRYNKRLSKYRGSQYVQVYDRVVVDRSDKHGRLVALVKDEQAAKLLAERKENKDVIPAGPVVVRRFLGWKKVEPTEPKKPEYKEINYPQHICTQMHNAGGK